MNATEISIYFSLKFYCVSGTGSEGSLPPNKTNKKKEKEKRRGFTIPQIKHLAVDCIHFGQHSGLMVSTYACSAALNIRPNTM